MKYLFHDKLLIKKYNRMMNGKDINKWSRVALIIYRFIEYRLIGTFSRVSVSVKIKLFINRYTWLLYCSCACTRVLRFLRKNVEGNVGNVLLQRKQCWQCFVVAEDSQVAVCQTCNEEISRGSSNTKTFNTNNLVYHLRTKPPEAQVQE